MGRDYLIQFADVEIFCDGNKSIGLGHIRRSAALCKNLIDSGIAARLNGISATASSLISVQEYRGGSSKILIFDVFEGIEDRILQAKNDHKICITLDWFGKEIPDINIVVYPHKEVIAQHARYIGFEYIILRDEITSLRKEKLPKSASRVFICLGGGDLHNQGHDTAIRLSDLGYDVTLVCGPLSDHKTVGKYKFKIIKDPPDFPRLLSECDWAVTNGGGCFFEAACLGKAAFILPQTDMEMAIAKFAEKKGAVLGIGEENLHAFALPEIRRVAEMAFSIIDGKGLDRVTAIIKNVL
jgi:spore coat polysaccharide biosynthesis predicted glycosyltransferase SpsG